MEDRQDDEQLLENRLVAQFWINLIAVLVPGLNLQKLPFESTSHISTCTFANVLHPVVLASASMAPVFSGLQRRANRIWLVSLREHVLVAVTEELNIGIGHRGPGLTPHDDHKEPLRIVVCPDKARVQ